MGQQVVSGTVFFFSPFSLDIYPNYGTHWHQPREFLLQKSLTNSKLVSIKVLTRCNQTETFLLIEKTNTHCLSFLFRFVDVGGDERERKLCVRVGERRKKDSENFLLLFRPSLVVYSFFSFLAVVVFI